MKAETTIDDALRVAAQILLRCTIMGVIVLLFWALAIELFGDFAYDVHSRLFPMSRAHFNLVHYAGLLVTKAAVSLLFFFPYIAIRLVLRQRLRAAASPAAAEAPPPGE